MWAIQYVSMYVCMYVCIIRVYVHMYKEANLSMNTYALYSDSKSTSNSCNLSEVILARSSPVVFLLTLDTSTPLF